MSTDQSSLNYSIFFDSGQNWEGLVSLWDGQWYRAIAENGYDLNYSLSSGEITAWAFFPLYPLLIKLLSFLGLPFWVAACAISILCTLFAVMLLFRICYKYSGSLWAGAFAIVPILINPAFFVTQSAYTEGLALLIVALVLYGLVNKKFLLVTVMLLVAGFARGIGIPLFLLVMIYLAVSFYKERRLSKSAILMAVGSVFAAASWPLIVAFFLKSPTASLELLALWVDAPKYPLYVIIGLPLVLLLLSANKKLPWQWRAWSFIYITYITASTLVTLGIIRYFMLALVSLPVVVEWIPKRFRAAIYSTIIVLLFALGAYGQCWWLSSVWIVTSEVKLGGMAIP